MVPIAIAERRLWEHVVEQAIRDAFAPAHSQASRRNRRENWRWLLRDTEDFPLVCELANLDPEILRAKLRQRLPSSPPAASNAAPAAENANHRKDAACEPCTAHSHGDGRCEFVRLDRATLQNRLQARNKQSPVGRQEPRAEDPQLPRDGSLDGRPLWATLNLQQ